jgi:RNA polymerase sigma factor for flagellar operon FliA
MTASRKAKRGAKKTTKKRSSTAKKSKRAQAKVGKKAAKKRAAKKAAKKATKKKTKKAAKKVTKTAPKRVTKKAAKAKVAKKTVKKAASKKAAKKKAKKDGEEPEVSTEELWTLYRKEAKKVGGKKGPGSPKLDALRNELIERHYPLVRYIAERLLQTLPKSIELDDLISAGLFGLMDAIRGFDPERGIKFKTYCSTRIRGAILDQLRSQDWVPRLVRLKASRIERALQSLTAEYGREPTHAELARALDMDHQVLVKEIQESRARTMFSLSEKWEDDDSSVEKVEVLEDKDSIDPVQELNRNDLMSFITRALTHKERFIIEQYYQYGHTMREIGEMLALTESRVCQIHSNVMGRLKGLLGQKQGTLLG